MLKMLFHILKIFVIPTLIISVIQRIACLAVTLDINLINCKELFLQDKNLQRIQKTFNCYIRFEMRYVLLKNFYSSKALSTKKSLINTFLLWELSYKTQGVLQFNVDFDRLHFSLPKHILQLGIYKLQKIITWDSVFLYIISIVIISIVEYLSSLRKYHYWIGCWSIGSGNNKNWLLIFNFFFVFRWIIYVFEFLGFVQNNTMSILNLFAELSTDKVPIIFHFWHRGLIRAIYSIIFLF